MNHLFLLSTGYIAPFLFTIHCIAGEERNVAIMSAQNESGNDEKAFQSFDLPSTNSTASNTPKIDSETSMLHSEDSRRIMNFDFQESNCDRTEDERISIAKDVLLDFRKHKIEK